LAEWFDAEFNPQFNATAISAPDVARLRQWWRLITCMISPGPRRGAAGRPGVSRRLLMLSASSDLRHVFNGA
jgi:hypothetical protein